MRAETAHEIIATQPRTRAAFTYARDSFAPRLLGYVLAGETRIADIKASRFARLLSRPMMAELVAGLGAGVITPDDLVHAEAMELGGRAPVLAYTIRFETWDARGDGWDMQQVSRTGVNLVVRLDFTGRHDKALRKLIGQESARAFRFDYHPGSDETHNTLAWARIDLDLETGEALIEEVQNDWLREAADLLRLATANDGVEIGGFRIPAHRWIAYVDRVLAPHRKVWAEAMLSAAIRVIVEDIGIRRIFMHDALSGPRIKCMDDDDDRPPRSLYTDLPRRFGFLNEDELPQFLEDDQVMRLAALRKDAPLTMWQLDLTPLERAGALRRAA